LRSVAESVCRYYGQLQQSTELSAAEQLRWARALLRLGDVQSDGPTPGEARATLEQARRLFDEVAARRADADEARVGRASANALIAQTELELGHADAAIADAERAVVELEALVARPGANPAWRRDLVDARVKHGQAFRAAGRLDASALTLRAALPIAER